MSSHDVGIEATVELPGLHITVSGVPSKVADFVRFVSTYSERPGRSPSPSTGSFELLSEEPSADPISLGRTGLETRDQIASTFSDCPPRFLALSGRLSGATLGGRGRILRAWTAGQWARAVLSSRVFTPNRTPTLDLRARFYAVARADSVECPVVFRSSASYWRAIGSLENSSSVSLSFPSELESRVYLVSAGFSEDSIQFLP